MMEELAGGTMEEGYGDPYPLRPESKEIELSATDVERILGVELETEQIVNILGSLEFDCRVVDGTVRAGVPYHRLDVTVAADLIEEVARVWGYERLPTTLMTDELPPQERDYSLEGEEKIRDILVGCGLTEVITYSLGNLETYGTVTAEQPEPDPEDYVRIANPLTREREYMRRTLMPSLLETLRDNLRYTDRVAVFEIGRVYLPQAGEELPDEPRRLCIAMTGPLQERSWLGENQEHADFFALKGVVETLLDRLALDESDFVPAEHDTFRAGGAAALLLGDTDIGVLGEVDAPVRDGFDLPEQPICLLELDLEELLARVEPIRHLQPLPRFPSVSQDMSLIVDEGVSAQQMEDLIRKAGGKLVVDVTLFDVYRGDPIPAGKKSLAYSLTYRHDEHTLTDKQVAKVHSKIVNRLSKELGAKLRE
jgi:phenylalanyl-tRNA synthetase beta chain